MHNFKKVVFTVVFLAMVILMNQTLLLALKPYNFFEIDIKNIKEKEYEDVFIGTSHGKAAIQPAVVEEGTGRKGINICLGGEYPIDSYYIVKEVLRQKSPKRIVYELDPGYWVTKASLGPDYATVYEELPWTVSKLEYFKDKMWRVDFRASLFPWYVYRQGYRTAWSNLKNRVSGHMMARKEDVSNEYQSYGEDGEVRIHRWDLPKTEDNLLLWDEEKLERESKEYFERLEALCEKENVELIVITTPIPKETLDKYQKNFKAANQFFQDYMKKKGITYYNFNYLEMDGVDTTLSGFMDYEGHMFEDEAEAFSRELGNVIGK